MTHSQSQPTIDHSTGEIIQEGVGEELPGRALVRAGAGELERRQAVGGLLRPVEAPAALLEAQEETRRLVAEVLHADRDYGVIPGTDRPSLLQPGAQRVAAAFGTAPRYRVLEAEVEHHREVRWTKTRKRFEHGRYVGKEEESGTAVGLYRFIVRCELVHRASGVVVGEGLASCSSLESRYCDRPRDVEHTVLAIAMKRALVNAVLQTFALSEQFQAAEEAPDSDPEPPDPEELARARARYFALLAEELPHPRIRELAREAYQRAHPLLPDSCTAWGLPHFQRAGGELEKFGARTFERAVAWLAEREPATPVDLELLERLEGAGELEAPDRELVDWLRWAGVSSWIRATLEQLGGTGGGGEEAGADAGEAGQGDEELDVTDPDDDLPF